MPTEIQTRAAPLLYIAIYFAGFLTACLWLNPQDYLADLAPTVTAVAALVCAWLVWLAAAHKIRSRTEWEKREQRIQREQIHPVLHAAVRLTEGSHPMLVLSVKNHGRGSAADIRFHIEADPRHPAAYAVARAAERLPVFSNGLDMLAAGETYSSTISAWDDIPAQPENGSPHGVVRLSLDYKNAFGEPCRSETVLEPAVLVRAL